MTLLNLQKSMTLAALILSPGLAFAGESVNESLKAEADGIVEIHNVRGNIKVVGWNKDQVEISGELDDLAEKLIFENQGKVTLINIKMPRRNINHGDGSNLIINIPLGNRLDMSGVSTDFHIENVSGGVDVRSVSGDVDIINVKKRLFVTTVSGDLTLKASSGKAKLGTVSGEIEGSFNSKEVVVDSVSGDIQLQLHEFSTLSATNVNGNVWVSGQLMDSGKTRMSTVNGDITLVFDQKVNARAYINAGPGGDISNHMSSDKVREIFPNQQKLKMTLGDGSGGIKIGTVNGSITLRGNND